MKGQRGRPRERDTIKMTALLYPEQKAKLEYLSEHLTGYPKVAGLLRQAVEEFLDRHFTAEFEADFAATGEQVSRPNEVPSEPLRIVR